MHRVSKWRRRIQQASGKTYPFTVATKTERIAMLGEARILRAMWTSNECKWMFRGTSASKKEYLGVASREE